MRCLTLAETLTARGDRVRFLCRPLRGHLAGVLEAKGFAPTLIADDAALGDAANAQLADAWEDDARATADWLGQAGGADLLILDHYSFDSRWEKIAAAHACKLLVIDDLADRPHDCDLLLDQNYYQDAGSRYNGKVPDRCRLLLGPRYTLLRPEFRAAKAAAGPKSGGVRRVLIFFGGMDPSNETGKTLSALSALPSHGITFDVVVGGQNPNREKVREQCVALPGAVFHQQIEYMSQLMAQADLAIGAGGASTWERCYLGLPCLTFILADNQIETTEALAAAGAIRNLGWARDIDAEGIRAAFANLAADASALVSMREACLAIMEGNSESRVPSALDELFAVPVGGKHA